MPTSRRSGTRLLCGAAVASSPARESLARSGVLSLGGSAFAALAALALTALVSNSYGPSGTGVFFQGVAVFTVVTQVLKLGTNSAIIRFIAGAPGQADSWRITLVAVVPVLLVSGLVAAAIALGASPLAELLAPATDADRLAGLLVSLAPFIIIGSVLGVLQTVARLVRGVGTFTILQSIALPASRLLVVAAVIAMAGGADGAFFGWLAVLAPWLVITIAVVAGPLLADRRRARAVPGENPASARTFWAFSAPRAVGASLETALDWSDVLVVAALTSPRDAGIYAVVTRAVRAGQVVDRAMRIAVSPRISHLLAVGDRAAATSLHTSVARGLILLSWPFYLTLALLGPAVLALFGPGFAEGQLALAILAVAMMISSASGMLQSVLLQGGRSPWQMYNKAAVLTLNIGLSLLLVPAVGIAGAAVSWLACLLLDTGLAAWQVHRLMGVRLQPRALVPSAVLPLVVFGLGCLGIRMLAGDSLLGLFVGLPVLALVYLAALRMLGRRLGFSPALFRRSTPRADQQPKRAGESSPARREG